MLVNAYHWARGVWLHFIAALLPPYGVLTVIDFYSPKLLTEDVRTTLGYMAMIPVVLAVLHYHFFVWACGIALDGPWTTHSWGTAMVQYPAIRLGEKGDVSVSFRLAHAKKEKDWVIWMVVDESAVIQDYGPKVRADTGVRFWPPLDELGNHSFLCVSGQASPTDTTPHLVTLKLSNDLFPPGSYIQFRAKVGKNINSDKARTKCQRCQGKNCTQKAMKTIIDFKALVVPSD
jgi:hypothetical protein